MILTSNDKFKKLYGKDLVMKVAAVDLVQLVTEKYGDKKQLLRPFERCGKYEVKEGANITWEQLLLFWDAKTESELITHTANVYLNCKKVDDLPLFDFVRLMNYARNVAIIAAEQFKTLKRDYTAEEIAAGIENMKSDHFDIVDSFIEKHPAYNHEQAFKTEWIIIFKTFKRQFENDNFQRRYSQIINKAK